MMSAIDDEGVAWIARLHHAWPFLEAGKNFQQHLDISQILFYPHLVGQNFIAISFFMPKGAAID